MTIILGNRNSAEVKRATVVGNPMFSANETNVEDKPTADLAALNDLQLDMDYDQIMHYFDNLKVCKNVRRYRMYTKNLFQHFVKVKLN